MSSHLIFLASYSAVTYFLAGCMILVSRVIKSQMQYRPLARKRNLCLVQSSEIAAFAFLWFGTSVSFTIFNKWLFSYWHRDGLPYPLLATSLHMLLKAILSRIFVRCRCSPFHQTLDPLPTPLLFKVIIPIALCTAGDIALSNLSVQLVTVTFYTIIKAGSLLWVLLWAVIFRLEKPSLRLFGICFLIAGGLFLSTFSDTAFSRIGLVLILGASCASGIRWGLVQVLMGHDSEQFTSMVVIYHIAPWAATFMFLTALGMEAPKMLSDTSFSNEQILVAILLALVGGVAAFVLLLAEVKLIQITSSLTLGVLGTSKELIQIVMAVLVFKDVVTWYNMTGLALAVGGTVLYNYVREDKEQEDIDYNPIAQADLELEEFGFLDESDDEDF